MEVQPNRSICREVSGGDQLSPFLFVLVAEVLNRMFGKAKEEELIEGIRVGRNLVDLSHLQFVDNTILFCLAKVKILRNYRYILDNFGILTGLSINYDKSALISLNCYEKKVKAMKKSLDCEVSALPITYLGIPLDANIKKDGNLETHFKQD